MGTCRQVVVQWTTRDVGSPVAQVGTASGAYTQTAVAVTNTYPRSEMVGPPANTFGYFDPVGQLFLGSQVCLNVCKPWPLDLMRTAGAESVS